MKKILIAVLFAPLTAFAQTYPSPTFSTLTLQNPLTAANGGTGATASTGSGSVVLGTSPTIAAPTVTGSFTATGLVTTADLSTQAANTILANATGSTASPTAFAMPSCSAATSALNYTSGTGIGCNSSINAATLGGATFAAPGNIGTGTPGTGAFTSLSSTSAPTLGAATIFPTVSSNAALQALSTVTTSTVTRLGYTTAADIPALNYQASASACSLNSGSGDNGSQVQSANGKCWIAQFPAGPLPAIQFGLDLTGATDNTTQLQNAWNYAASVGKNLLLPATGSGYVKFSTLTMPVPTGYFSGASALVGDLGNTTIKSTVTGTTCAINVAATIGQPNFGGTGWGGWALWSLNNAGFGLCLNAVSHFTSNSFSIINFAYQIYALDTFTVTMNRPILENGQHGIYANYNALSYPNDWNINQGYVSGQTQDGLLIYSPSDFNLHGGDYEGINTANTGGFCTINIQGNPVNGTKGLAIFGGYFQDNGGNGDICITQNASGNGSGPGVHSITGVEFGRISNTTYVTHEVVLANGNSGATTVVSMHGNSFNNFNSYVVSAARAFWAVSAPATANYKLVGWGDNKFGNTTEAPGDCIAAGLSACVNLPDGHIEQWGTATSNTTGTGFPVTVTWPLACPNAVDSLVTSAYNNTTPFTVGVASYTATTGTLVASTASSLIQWRMVCH